MSLLEEENRLLRQRITKLERVIGSVKKMIKEHHEEEAPKGVIQCYTAPSTIVTQEVFMQRMCRLIIKGQGPNAVCQIIKRKHFNSNNPKEHNVRVNPEKRIISFYKRGVWEPHEMSRACELLVNHVSSDLMEYVGDSNLFNEKEVYQLNRWYDNLQFCTNYVQAVSEFLMGGGLKSS